MKLNQNKFLAPFNILNHWIMFLFNLLIYVKNDILMISKLHNVLFFNYLSLINYIFVFFCVFLYFFIEYNLLLFCNDELPWRHNFIYELFCYKNLVIVFYQVIFVSQKIFKTLWHNLYIDIFAFIGYIVVK